MAGSVRIFLLKGSWLANQLITGTWLIRQASLTRASLTGTLTWPRITSTGVLNSVQLAASRSPIQFSSSRFSSTATINWRPGSSDGPKFIYDIWLMTSGPLTKLKCQTPRRQVNYIGVHKSRDLGAGITRYVSWIKWHVGLVQYNPEWYPVSTLRPMEFLGNGSKESSHALRNSYTGVMTDV